jgi:hypothetical protein
MVNQAKQRRLTMHPYLHEYFARQRRDMLLQEVATTHLLHDHDHQPPITSIRPLLLYLLAGSPRPSGKPSQQWCYEQAQSRAALRLTGVVALALGVLAGSLLDGQFGLTPAVLLDSTMLLVVLVLVVMRSIGLVTGRKL